MDEKMALRMMVGKMAQDEWEANPPDIEEWARALEGCSTLFAKAAEHLRADPPNYEEAGRCLGVATRVGEELAPQVALAYAMSGQAADSMLRRIRDSLQ